MRFSHLKLPIKAGLYPLVYFKYLLIFLLVIDQSLKNSNGHEVTVRGH